MHTRHLGSNDLLRDEKVIAEIVQKANAQLQ
jgi:hypothetical protein